MATDPANLYIVHYPYKTLREKAEIIDPIDDEVRAIAEKMIVLMTEAEGLGLAAPQLGISRRLFVTSATEKHPERVYVNPVITLLSNVLEILEEGCLSLPDIRVEIRRPYEVEITALDLEGNAFTLREDGMMARVWQHELDHLNGVLIIDKMSPKDKIANRRALRDLKAQAE